jgi:spermidine synthase
VRILPHLPAAVTGIPGIVHGPHPSASLPMHHSIRGSRSGLSGIRSRGQGSEPPAALLFSGDLGEQNFLSVTINIMMPSRIHRGLAMILISCASLWVLARAQQAEVIYEVQSQYQYITVQDTGYGYRQLIFDGRFDGSDAIQSEMNLSNPDELTLSYSRHIMTALPMVPEIHRILVVGLGGACMQRYLYKLLPAATIETAEIDPEIRNVAERFFFFKEDARQIVHLGDGRTFIENSKDAYDIIFLDAFSATSIPYRLATQEFLQAVKGHLAEGGIACANLWDGEGNYPDMLKTYASVFPEVHVVKCSYSGNSILLALPHKAGLTTKEWVEKATEFEKAHPTGLNLPQLVERGAEEPTVIPENATVLVDKKTGIVSHISGR